MEEFFRFVVFITALIGFYFMGKKDGERTGESRVKRDLEER